MNIEEIFGIRVFDDAAMRKRLPERVYESLSRTRRLGENLDPSIADVVVLKLGTLVVEAYENHAAVLRAGAIDHVALDVKDIEEIYQYINQAGLNTTQDSIHFLPFWENGVKFFTIEGPNKEKVEFSQYL